MEDLKKYLTGKVLMYEADTLPPETVKVLSQIRREKTDRPVIYLSSGTSSKIAGSEKTYSAVSTYITENESKAELVMVGCTGPANFEPMLAVQLPGKNKLFFRNITEEKVEPLLNGVFHNDINKDEIIDFVNITREKPIDIRFIELMPIGEAVNYKGITNKEVLNIIEDETGQKPDTIATDARVYPNTCQL